MYRIASLTLIALGLLAQAAFAAPRPKPDFSKPQAFLHLADAFADEQDYYRAITEYKKVIFLFPDYEKLEWVHFQIGKMYYEGGRFPQAKHELLPLTESKDENLKFFALNYIALSGALHAIGGKDKPTPPLNLVGDFGGGGMLLAFGICAALVRRGITGVGQVVDAAMVDGAAMLMTSMLRNSMISFRISSRLRKLQIIY